MMSDVHEIARIVNESGLGLKGAYAAGLLPASDKTISKQLKKGGYAYDTATKQWQLTETAATAPADPQQYELLPALSIAFNDDELAALKQVAQQLISGNMNITTVAYDNSDIELYERSRQLEKCPRIRKTYVVSEALAARFDTVADRSNIDKSQLLELALSDFLQRYS